MYVDDKWYFYKNGLPYYYINGSSVVYNDEIHILGSYFYADYPHTGTKHYKYNGSTWTEVSTLPYYSYGTDSSFAVVYKDEIHILGNSGINRQSDANNSTKHYKYNGSTWTEVDTLPRLINGGSSLVYKNDIYMLGGYESYSRGSVISEWTKYGLDYNTLRIKSVSYYD